MRQRLGTALALALLLPATAGAQALTIQPGDQALYPDVPPGTLPLPGGCSLGWLFDGSDGHAYFSIAAHCGGRGHAVTTRDGERLGTVAMSAGDGYGGDAPADVALIRVTEPMESRVAGAMRGHETIPTGVISPTEAVAGDAIVFSGWGIGFNNAQQTREQRPAVFTMGSELEWHAVAPTINGDSGTGVAHGPSGRALGLQKGHSCAASAEPTSPGATCGSYGPSIAAIERLAGSLGLKLTLRVAGQPAPPKPAAPAEEPPGSETPAAPGTRPAPAKKPSAKTACRKKAKRIKNKRKRRAALRRCAKKR